MFPTASLSPLLTWLSGYQSGLVTSARSLYDPLLPLSPRISSPALPVRFARADLPYASSLLDPRNQLLRSPNYYLSPNLLGNMSGFPGLPFRSVDQFNLSQTPVFPTASLSPLLTWLSGYQSGLVTSARSLYDPLLPLSPRISSPALPVRFARADLPYASSLLDPRNQLLRSPNYYLSPNLLGNMSGFPGLPFRSVDQFNLSQTPVFPTASLSPLLTWLSGYQSGLVTSARSLYDPLLPLSPRISSPALPVRFARADLPYASSLLDPRNQLLRSPNYYLSPNASPLTFDQIYSQKDKDVTSLPYEARYRASTALVSSPGYQPLLQSHIINHSLVPI